MITKYESVRGSINISDQTIAKIVSSAIQRIREVIALIDGRTKRTDKHTFYKAVGIRIEETEIFIELRTVVLMGIPLHLLSRNLQMNVKQEVEELTGLTVSKVNVDIVEVIPV